MKFCWMGLHNWKTEFIYREDLDWSWIEKIKICKNCLKCKLEDILILLANQFY